MKNASELLVPHQEFLVVCLCAEWCGTCRDYKAAFQTIQMEFPEVGFLWADIEDEASWIEDFAVDDFPTILIQRNEWVLFYGTMLPQQNHLRRTLEVFRAQTLEQSRDYAYGNDERRGWQAHHNLRAVLKSLHSA